MNQVNVVAAAIFGSIVSAFAYMFNFYPVVVLACMLGLVAYVAFAPAASSKKKAPPSEPWYMK